MFKDAFIKLDPTQAEKMVAQINPFLDSPLDVTKTSVLIHDLSFYKDFFLAELCRHDVHPEIIRAAICNKKGDVHVLNWTNEIIFKLNKSVPVDINDNTVMDYIRFFFSYVKGKHGRFLIVESVDDIDWREEPAPAGRKALSKMIEPMSLKAKEEGNVYIFKTCVVFKDSLFAAEVKVAPDGHIQMLNEELLVEDIPVGDDVFGQ